MMISFSEKPNELLQLVKLYDLSATAYYVHSVSLCLFFTYLVWFGLFRFVNNIKNTVGLNPFQIFHACCLN